MNYKRFLEITQEGWDDYFKIVEKKISLGIIHAKTSKGEKAEILFPNILLITETKSHYLAELIGACDTFNGLQMKSHKEISVSRYLNQFNTNETQSIVRAATDDCRGLKIGNLLFCPDMDFENLKARFPFVDLHKTRLTRPSNAEGSYISLGRNFRDVIINNCLFVNTYLSSIRIKHILHLTLINKEMLALDYSQWLKENLNQRKNILGLHTYDPLNERDLILASQFASTYLFYGLKETTIGEFLDKHHEIIQRAVGGRKVIYEPYLKWKEKLPENTDTAINPDLMIEREDGFYDIYDLKTALLNKNSLTKGERRRRRFIDYVEEGIAQLANYKEYFTYPNNSEYALNKYGIKVNQPNVVLVVGNFDNANKTEIEEASRRLKDISIIDYDTFLQLFLNSQP